MSHVLYSYRRCPYAMRARLTLIYAGMDFQVREIELRSKPKSMLEISPKGTVPVLLTKDQLVIEESLDIMLWALTQNDPDLWLPKEDTLLRENMNRWITLNDGSFKTLLDQYKYPQRYPMINSQETLEKAIGIYLKPLDELLSKSKFLLGNSITMLDVALFPFVRQFYKVNENQFEKLSLKFLTEWLNFFILSDLFHKAMAKYPVWRDDYQ